jgi:hypothetical protein
MLAFVQPKRGLCTSSSKFRAITWRSCSELFTTCENRRMDCFHLTSCSPVSLLALLSRETPDWFHFALENGKFLRQACTSLYLRSHPIAQSPDSLDHLITTHYCWDTSICYLVSDLCDNRYRNRYRHFQPTTPEVLYRITVAGDSKIWMVRIF